MESSCELVFVFAISPKRKSYNISDARTHTDHNIIPKEDKKKNWHKIFYFLCVTMVDLHFDNLNFFHTVGLNS